MRSIILKPVFLISLVFSVGCLVSCETYYAERHQELQQGTKLAREMALSEPGLDQASKDMITTNSPTIGSYPMAGPYGHYEQYGIAWRISTNRTLTVYGQGDIRKLDRAKVTIENGY